MQDIRKRQKGVGWGWRLKFKRREKTQVNKTRAENKGNIRQSWSALGSQGKEELLPALMESVHYAEAVDNGGNELNS